MLKRAWTMLKELFYALLMVSVFTLFFHALYRKYSAPPEPIDCGYRKETYI